MYPQKNIKCVHKNKHSKKKLFLMKEVEKKKKTDQFGQKLNFELK